MFPSRSGSTWGSPGNKETDESKKSEESNWRRGSSSTESEIRRSLRKTNSSGSKTSDQRSNQRQSTSREADQPGPSNWRLKCSSSTETNVQRSSPITNPSPGSRSSNQGISQHQSIFRGANPVSTHEKDQEIERRLQEDKEYKTSNKAGPSRTRAEKELSRSQKSPNFASGNRYSGLAKSDDDSD